MDQVFELSTTDRFDDLLLRKNKLAKPNSYYQQLHPTEAAESDAKLAEDKKKAEAKTAAATAPKPPPPETKPA